jgi:hypothetical protein
MKKKEEQKLREERSLEGVVFIETGFHRVSQI